MDCSTDMWEVRDYFSKGKFQIQALRGTPLKDSVDHQGSTSVVIVA